jgi:hypothetical protein
MKNRTHFAHRVDAWDDEGDNIVEYLACVGDVAMTTYSAACQRWPGAAPVAGCKRTDDRWLPRGRQERLGRGLGNGIGDRSITTFCA